MKMHLWWLLVTIVSFIITISTFGIAIFLIKYFINSARVIRQGENIQIKRYFKITASITLIFNALNTFFNSVYCVYLLFDCPLHNNEFETFYVYHPSHYQRIASTVSWYIAKVSLIWFFSGRLYHGFKGSSLRINRSIVLFINSFNTLFAPTSLCFAYWWVYNNHLIFAEIAFNMWRIQYQIVVFVILLMFSKRLLFLTMRELHATNDNINRKGGKHRIYLLNITTRNAILVTTISFTVFLVSFCFFGFRFLFGRQTRLTLLIPLSMAAIDSLCTSICMICLFANEVGDKIYFSLCKVCDRNIYKLFIFMAKKQITNNKSKLTLSSSMSISRIPDKMLRITRNRTSLNIDKISCNNGLSNVPCAENNIVSSVPSSSTCLTSLGTVRSNTFGNELSDITEGKMQSNQQEELQVILGNITSHSAPLSEPLSEPFIKVDILKIDSHSEPVNKKFKQDHTSKTNHSKSNSSLLKKDAAIYLSHGL